MSKPKHHLRYQTKFLTGFEGSPSVDRRINDARKGARSYKSNVFDAHQNDLRKQTLITELQKHDIGFIRHYAKQNKVRPVAQARLNKLKRYIDRSWRIGSKGVFDDLR